DIIIGHPIEGRPNWRYVRLPDQRRTYVARVDSLDISTRFEDWIERNLLQVERLDIDQIIIRNHSTDPKTGGVNQREMLIPRRPVPCPSPCAGGSMSCAPGLRPGTTSCRTTISKRSGSSAVSSFRSAPLRHGHSSITILNRPLKKAGLRAKGKRLMAEMRLF